MADRLLVTGGAGFIGSHLVDALLERGYQVRVYDNLEPQVHGGLREEGRWPAYLSPEAERILGDIRDREGLRRALAGVDGVFHLAALVGVGQSMVEVERFVDVNLRGTGILLDLLVNERHRVQKLIVPGSVAVYGEGRALCGQCGEVFPKPRSTAQLQAQQWETTCPRCGGAVTALPSTEEDVVRPASVYALTKYGQEQMCLSVGRTLGITTVALRYFNVYGPRQSSMNPYTGVVAIFARQIGEGRPPTIYEDGRQTRDFIHVSDVGRANLAVLKKVQEGAMVLNVGSGRQVTIRQVAELVADALGWQGGTQMTGEYRPGDVRYSWADLAQARQRLGYTPRVSLTEGIGNLAMWLQKSERP